MEPSAARCNPYVGPRPFTRARVDIAAPIYVGPDADDGELDKKRDELQRALDEVSRRGEQWRAAIF